MCQEKPVVNSYILNNQVINYDFLVLFIINEKILAKVFLEILEKELNELELSNFIRQCKEYNYQIKLLRTELKNLKLNIITRENNYIIVSRKERKKQLFMHIITKELCNFIIRMQRSEYEFIGLTEEMLKKALHTSFIKYLKERFGQNITIRNGSIKVSVNEQEIETLVHDNIKINWRIYKKIIPIRFFS